MISRWPSWSAYAAAAWSFCYGGLGLYWATGGGGFPFAPIDDTYRSGSILEGTSAAVVAPIMAAVGLAGALAALLMARRKPSVALVCFGWTMAVALTLVIPDYTMLALLAFAPLLLVFAFTGVPGPQEGIGDILYWHRTNLVLIFVGGLLWAVATLAYQRRVRGACEHCGRRAGHAGPSGAALLRRGRWAVAVAVLAPLPYEVTRVSWFLGFPLGIGRDFLRMMQDTPGMLEVGLGCAVASTIGGVLTHGLVSHWGEVYPRWIWFKAGRRVPPALAIVPASIVAVSVIPAGLMILWTMDVRDGWALYVPSLLWLAWGAGLGAATVAYYLRRRPACRYCADAPSPGTRSDPDGTARTAIARKWSSGSS